MALLPLKQMKELIATFWVFSWCRQLISRHFSCADLFCKFVQTLSFCKNLQNGKRDKSFISYLQILWNSYEGHNRKKNKHTSEYDMVALFLSSFWVFTVAHAPVIQLLSRPNFGTEWVRYQLGVTVLRYVGGLCDHL